jgi:hypothetical protein
MFVTLAYSPPESNFWNLFKLLLVQYPVSSFIRSAFVDFHQIEGAEPKTAVGMRFSFASFLQPWKRTFSCVLWNPLGKETTTTEHVFRSKQDTE